jgi:hypothetical protein
MSRVLRILASQSRFQSLNDIIFNIDRFLDLVIHLSEKETGGGTCAGEGAEGVGCVVRGLGLLATPRIVFIQSGIVSSSNIPPSSNTAIST